MPCECMKHSVDDVRDCVWQRVRQQQCAVVYNDLSVLYGSSVQLSSAPTLYDEHQVLKGSRYSALELRHLTPDISTILDSSSSRDQTLTTVLSFSEGRLADSS